MVHLLSRCSRDNRDLLAPSARKVPRVLPAQLGRKVLLVPWARQARLDHRVLQALKELLARLARKDQLVPQVRSARKVPQAQPVRPARREPLALLVPPDRKAKLERLVLLVRRVPPVLKVLPESWQRPSTMRWSLSLPLRPRARRAGPCRALLPSCLEVSCGCRST